MSCALPQSRAGLQRVALWSHTTATLQARRLAVKQKWANKVHLWLFNALSLTLYSSACCKAGCPRGQPQHDVLTQPHYVVLYPGLSDCDDSA